MPPPPKTTFITFKHSLPPGMKLPYKEPKVFRIKDYKLREFVDSAAQRMIDEVRSRSVDFDTWELKEQNQCMNAIRKILEETFVLEAEST